MRFLRRFIKPSADENEDGWQLDVEGEDASTGEEISIGKAASIRRSMMRLLKRHQSVDGDDSGVAGDLEEFSDSIAAGLGSDADAVSLLASQVSGPSETGLGGPEGDQAVVSPQSSSASPTPVFIVDDPDAELADATSMDKSESAMLEKGATDAPNREAAPPPAEDTTKSAMPEKGATDAPNGEAAPPPAEDKTESTPPEQTATPDNENDPGGFDILGSDIFAEESTEDDGLRVLTESMDEVDAAELAVDLRSLVDELRNR